MYKTDFAQTMAKIASFTSGPIDMDAFVCIEELLSDSEKVSLNISVATTGSFDEIARIKATQLFSKFVQDLRDLTDPLKAE